MKTTNAILAILFLVFISACSSSSNGQSSVNAPIKPGSPAPPGADEDPEISACLGNLSGGGTEVSSSEQACPTCTISDADKAIDALRDTYATMTFDPVGGSATLRATSQSGVVFPAGYMAGLVMRLPDTRDPNAAIQLCIRTYLQGAMQETDSNYCSSPNVVSGLAGGEDMAFKFSTTEPYDAVEVAITRTGGTDSLSFRVYEYCSHQ